MGLNAQISVPAFTTGQVLTAQQQTDINTGIPVFATTVTRDAAFGGTGEKVLAEGQYAYIEATNTTQFYDGAAWQAVGGGLTYITQATPSAQTSISINNCFTSTYENYRIVINLSAFAVADGNLSLRLRVGGVDTSTNYVSQRLGATGATVFAGANILGTYEMYLMSVISAEPRTSAVAFDMFAPQLATDTTCVTHFGGLDVINGNVLITTWNAQNSNTAYDGFTLIGTQAITGTVRVYGYQNS
jgi:hypothetical protein